MEYQEPSYLLDQWRTDNFREKLQALLMFIFAVIGVVCSAIILAHYFLLG